MISALYLSLKRFIQSQKEIVSLVTYAIRTSRLFERGKRASQIADDIHVTD